MRTHARVETRACANEGAPCEHSDGCPGIESKGCRRQHGCCFGQRSHHLLLPTNQLRTAVTKPRRLQGLFSCNQPRALLPRIRLLPSMHPFADIADTERFAGITATKRCAEILSQSGSQRFLSQCGLHEDMRKAVVTYTVQDVPTLFLLMKCSRVDRNKTVEAAIQLSAISQN
jgi:hypothetical protein